MIGQVSKVNHYLAEQILKSISVEGNREVYKKNKGQNKNSAPFKIQYPMKNRDESSLLF